MDAATPIPPLRYNRLLPYWAVFQMDMRQTARSWLFRVWILAAVLLGSGYLLHRWTIHEQAGIVQSAATLMKEVIQIAILAGTSLVIVLTAGAISSDRGIMADSVLSRGISRYQYFLGKLHARLALILGSFLFVTIALLVSSSLLLQMDLSVLGALLALVVSAALLGIVITCGVTISSLCNSSLLGTALLLIGVYGVGVGLWFLEYGQFNPQRLNRMLPALLAGQYDFSVQLKLVGWCALIGFVASLVGLVHFARRDV
jgi:ABC-type transport system involved in multi-copper enzyme maturation permease subunit